MYAADWEQEQEQGNGLLWRGKNGSSTDAACEKPVRAQFAVLEGSHAVSMFADHTKFSEIARAVLWKEAWATNLPWCGVQLCLAMYGGSRRIRAHDSLSKAVSASQGVVAK